MKRRPGGLQRDRTPRSVRRGILMRGKLSIAPIAALLVALVVLSSGEGPEVRAQRVKAEQQAFEYKVIPLGYNPGERLNDGQRAAQFEKLLNAEAKSGWEPVTSLLTRTTIQTVGGGVT